MYPEVSNFASTGITRDEINTADSHVFATRNFDRDSRIEPMSNTHRINPRLINGLDSSNKAEVVDSFYIFRESYSMALEEVNSKFADLYDNKVNDLIDR